MRKKYQKPSINIYSVQAEGSLMAGSDVTYNGTTPSNGGRGGDPTQVDQDPGGSEDRGEGGLFD